MSMMMHCYPRLNISSVHLLQPSACYLNIYFPTCQSIHASTSRTFKDRRFVCISTLISYECILSSDQRCGFSSFRNITRWCLCLLVDLALQKKLHCSKNTI
ncbi:hypothetical protein T07_10858 [Trichinella nelsoni]|uniref:Uncharacterized protein n=1 Tax=Trichinella nelsoni TaxID=6336 RepID=A0A0V0SBI3_9BILA|nr:hypothetical protein T07_10858 [Trichinella nelsoni]